MSAICISQGDRCGNIQLNQDTAMRGRRCLMHDHARKDRRDGDGQMCVVYAVCIKGVEGEGHGSMCEL